jgi:hypothetical protein
MRPRYPFLLLGNQCLIFEDAVISERVIFLPGLAGEPKDPGKDERVPVVEELFAVDLLPFFLLDRVPRFEGR